MRPNHLPYFLYVVVCMQLTIALDTKIDPAADDLGNAVPASLSGNKLEAGSHTGDGFAQGSPNGSLALLLQEMQELETMIALQTRKLTLLEAMRLRVLAGEELSPAAATALQQAMRLDGVAAVDLAASQPIDGNEPEWRHHLLPELTMDLPYSVVASIVVIAKVKRLPGHFGTETLLGLVDTAGLLHVLSAAGEEVCVYDLQHVQPVTVLAFDGTDSKKAVFISAAADGSVHVMSMEVTRNTSLAAKQTIAVNISTTYKYMLHEVAPSEMEGTGSRVGAGRAHATSLLIYVKQSIKSFVLLVGDSEGRVTLCALNGESKDVHVISAGEPILSMARLGTLVAISAGHDVHIHVMGRFELLAKVCSSGGVRQEDKLTHISMDMGSSPFLFARTVDGKILTFDTKTRGKNAVSGKPDVFCTLVSALPPQAAGDIFGSVSALKNMVIFGHECSLALYSTDNIKNSGSLSLIDDIRIDEHPPSAPCVPASFGFDSSASHLGLHGSVAFLPPKTERTKAVEAFFLVSVNLRHPLPDPAQCIDSIGTCTATGQSGQSRVQLYRTVEKSAMHIESSFGDMLKGMDGWAKIPMFLVVFFGIFLWNGGMTMFRKKAVKRNRYGVGDEDSPERNGETPPSAYDRKSYASRSANSIGASQMSNSRAKHETVKELREVSVELERLQRMTDALRRQTPAGSTQYFEEDD